MARRAIPRAAAKAASADVQTPRPTHIVLFKSVSERNIAAVSGVLRARESTSVLGLSSARMMLVDREPRVAARMYDGLGVAAITATPEAVSELRSDPAVEDVFPNELRSIPPLPTTARRTSAGLAGLSSGLEYVRGLRDGLNVALDALEGRVPHFPQPIASPTPSTRAVDEATLTWGLQAIGISATYPFSGKGVKVAVLDTGVDLRHPDLASRFRDGHNARNFIGGSTAQDGHGHGTHCIGTVGGPVNSRFGPRYGVAPDCEVLAGKVLSDAGSGFDDGIIDGIQWAIDMGAHVVSLSLGSARSQNGAFSELYERLAERALEGSPGTLIVAAAGNESERPAFTQPVGNPAACPSVIAVAASDRDHRVAWFSCRAMDGIGRIDITAPGVDVLSAAAGGGTTRMNGTSMATPHVAGVAALRFEATPGTTARAVWDGLVNEARPLGDPADFGAGLIQAPT